MTLTSSVIPAVEGDSTTVDGELRFVGPRCDCERVGYWCLTCRQLCANLLQAEWHVEHTPPHTIARDCRDHLLNAL